MRLKAATPKPKPEEPKRLFDLWQPKRRGLAARWRSIASKITKLIRR